MTTLYSEQIIQTLQLEGLPTTKSEQDLYDIISNHITIDKKLCEIQNEAKTIAAKQYSKQNRSIS